ncbi:MAG: MarR family transcriptional regulator [Ruminiclostridium sp.]|nr:MarR family transcriptional regulator [Ruminiclostridium sp.]
MNKTSLSQTQIDKMNLLLSEIDGIYHTAALKLNLADSTLAILYVLRTEENECSISDICKVTGIGKQTINSALRKMEQDGIIQLRAMDGRKKTVTLTEKGITLSKTTADRLIEAENTAIVDWSSEEISEYLRLMRKFRDCLKKEIDKM